MRLMLVRMIPVILLFAAVCVSVRADDHPASQPATTAPTVKWEDAAKHVGETVSITGPVMGTHAIASGKSLVLNIGKDYPDAARFTIMMDTSKDKAEAAAYTGKTVTVTGKVELYRKVPEIKAAVADVVIQK